MIKNLTKDNLPSNAGIFRLLLSGDHHFERQAGVTLGLVTNGGFETGDFYELDHHRPATEFTTRIFALVMAVTAVSGSVLAVFASPMRKPSLPSSTPSLAPFSMLASATNHFSVVAHGNWSSIGHMICDARGKSWRWPSRPGWIAPPSPIPIL